jgi:hypothetical protein
MAPDWLKTIKTRFKDKSSETDEKSPDAPLQKPGPPQPALSQEDLVRILKIIKKYNQ